MKAKDLLQELQELPYKVIMEEMVNRFRTNGIYYIHRIGNVNLSKIEEMAGRFRQDGYIVTNPEFDEGIKKYIIEISLVRK